MKITFEAEPKEIAALVLEIQGQQGMEMDFKAVAQSICGKGEEAQEKT